MKTNNHCPILGCLLGTSVGDALGLPTEGMSRKRASRYHHDSLGHRLAFGHGMFSDDTEHTLMVAVALAKHPHDPQAFQKSLAGSMRWWLFGLPAGVGLSTAKAIFRLWLGFPPTRAGVRSAGNGAAMRSAIIGVAFREDQTKRHAFALAACRLTHTDPRAEESALLVAEAAALAAKQTNTEQVIETLRPLLRSTEMTSRFATLESGLQRQISVSDYAAEIGCVRGVSGFAPNTFAVALFAWLRHRGDFAAILRNVIACGGDTDTVAAIAGGIGGSEVGEGGLPVRWVQDICDWPRSMSYIRHVAESLEARMRDDPVSIPQLFAPMILLRNVVFLLIVILHGFRRLLPPY